MTPCSSWTAARKHTEKVAKLRSNSLDQANDTVRELMKEAAKRQSRERESSAAMRSIAQCPDALVLILIVINACGIIEDGCI